MGESVDFGKPILVVRQLFQSGFQSAVLRSCNNGNAQLPSASGITAGRAVALPYGYRFCS